MAWNPSQYLQYEDARLRPAIDLALRVPLASPRHIVDLGCGAGNVAAWLARRWPDAAIEGVDGDEAMLAKARERSAGDARFRWTRADLGEWRPAGAPDLVYSNAALHWIDDHRGVFPRLMQSVVPGGVLAVQMPDNFAAPSHAGLFATARGERWRAKLAPLVREAPVASPADYYDWLVPHAKDVDVWRTEYLQRLAVRDDAEHPVVAWMRGSALIPFVGALPAEDARAFVADYAARIEHAYARRADGSVLFPFRRLFVVATRR
jgi:trans-aconitate 2-methyltransferase